MKSSDAPSKQSVPFGVNGSRQSILDTTPTGSNAASYDVGFPPITMILKSAGGLPPLGQNWNQILYELSGISRFLSAGGGYVYDSTFSTAVGGYPAGAIIPNSTLNGLWINTVDDNTTNPENSTAALTGWVPAFSYGTTSFSGLTSASVTVGTLDASKDVITLTGLLTANINLVLPAWIKKWDIVNNTTGAFTVTVKTPSGTGVAVSAGSKVPVIGDGTNINTNYAPGSFIRKVRYSSAGTYSYAYGPGTKSVYVRLVGGGGGGAGAEGTSSTSLVSGGSGGGGGGYAELTTTISSLSASTTVVVGAGGTAGNGNTGGSSTNGGSGGTTSFGSICSATGGSGGSYQTTSSGATLYQQLGGSGGSGTSGDRGSRGGVGGRLLSTSTANSTAGEGGGSAFTFGPGGSGGSTVVAGTAGTQGAGGSGAINATGSSTGRLGGTGGPGYVEIWEYA